jgi:FdhD protein
MSEQANSSVWRWDGNTLREDRDDLAREEPLEIRVRGRAVSVTMRTPGHDEELAAGFLLTESIVRSAADILKVEHCSRNDEENILNVVLAPEVAVDFAKLTRHVFASSSCGLCGKATIDSVMARCDSIKSDVAIDIDVFSELPDRMRQAQSTFERTGGLHAAGLFDAKGELVVLREDVGRHNAVDKVIGYCLFRGIVPDRHVLLVSGRSSFEIVQKALAGRIPVIAAISAPSSLAVEFARESGITLIGFLRGRRMNIYSHHEHVRLPSDEPAGRASFTSAPPAKG